MEKELSPLELMDKFLNSDPAYIKNMLEEFDDLYGEGPSVIEYFQKYDTAFDLFDNHSEKINDYERIRDIEVDLESLYPKSITLRRLNVKTAKAKTNYRKNDISTVYSLAS